MIRLPWAWDYDDLFMRACVGIEGEARGAGCGEESRRRLHILAVGWREGE
jgi:hypothetical protein